MTFGTKNTQGRVNIIDAAVLGFIALGLLFLILLQTPRSKGGRSPRLQCLSNQKQVGIAFRIWANDHGEVFPMALAIEKGGGREFALAGESAALFRVMSKELHNPKVLYCPKDTERFGTTDFAGLAERNLSYLVGIDANELNPQTILSGDRNVTLDGAQLGRGLALITNPKAVAWSSALHDQQGNIGLADGSAYQVNHSALQRQLESSQLATNRFAVP